MRKSNQKQKSPIVLFWATGLVLLILAVGLSLFNGRFAADPATVIQALMGSADNPVVANIILTVRLPRILLVILVGAGLAISGAAFQGVFQNPLVSPDVLAVSSGAAFGAVLSIMLNGSSTLLVLLALSFGMVAVALTYNFARVRGSVTTLSLILSGMIMSSLFNALISLMKYVANAETQLPEITYWLLGSFAGTTFKDVAIAAGPVIIGSIALIAMGNRINILSLGDDEATSLGINPTRSRLVVIFFATLVTSACITVTGIIGWVGLIIPHIARFIVGPNHTRLIPASILLGAIFMTVVDLVARSLLATEIPVGVLTALIGAPFFMAIFHFQAGKRL